jgi:uncharacterized protein DUF6221
VSGVDDLVAFLTARLDERQAAAEAADRDLGGARGWWVEDDVTVAVPVSDGTGGTKGAFTVARTDFGGRPIAEYIALHDPAAVLADVEAKRRLLALHSPTPGPNPSCNTCFDGWAAVLEAANWPCASVRLLALPFASHPDYREEWKP